MTAHDPRVDAYIAKSAEFAQPILTHLRAVAHAANTDIEETIKWGMPTFTLGGKIVCNMAAFTQHCAFNLWRGRRVVDAAETDAMGQFGRITKARDLPTKKVLVGYLKQLIRLQSETPATPARKRASRAESEAPACLATALKKNLKARATFEKFAPGQRREYIEWINEAKRDDTRDKRLSTTLEWLAEGKTRNWKYKGR